MYLIRGKIITPIENGITKEVIPVDTYVMDENQLLGTYIQQIDMSELPSRLYGDTHKRADRIINTFENRSGKNLGVLLMGEKGSGKTLLAKTVAQKALKRNYPVIMINTALEPQGVCKFISNIKSPCVLVFDEFEKNFPNDSHQNSLLTLLDGMYNSNHIFILTVNDSWRVGNFLINRPGRIYYKYEYKGVDVGFIEEYCNDKLINKDFLKDIIKISNIIPVFNFDSLQAIVEESNRYNESPMEFIDFMNISMSKEKVLYTLEAFDDETGIKFCFYNEYLHSISQNVEIESDESSYEGIPEDRMEVLRNEIIYRPDDMVNFNKNEIVYKKFGTTVKLKRKVETLGFSKFLDRAM